MRAVRLHEYDRRPVVEDVPEPRITGPLDVLVEIGGAGLCRTDLHIVEGQWAQKSGVALPYTIGHENAGWVREVGPAVANVRPGDAVILHPLVTCGLCRACRAGDDAHCADASLTAYHAVRKAAPLLYPGTRVVVIGAGGLGHIGVQCLAALTPAEIIVVDRSPAALDLVRGLGATHTVPADGRQVEAVADLTGGQGAHVVLDFVGEGGTEAEGVAMLRRAGSYFVIGYGGRVDIPTIDIISAEINVIGNLVGSFNDLNELMALAAQGKVTLHTRTYPLEAVYEAMDDLDGGRLQGRGILVPARG
jgi:NAD+-dependent secondary alcohol dehydrogenase Adh1